jgi:hypothetical protein
VEQKTHQEVKEPEISVRYLADFMAASERKRRSIVEGCKYRPIARLVQHKEAMLAISGAIQKGPLSPCSLREASGAYSITGFLTMASPHIGSGTSARSTNASRRRASCQLPS